MIKLSIARFLLTIAAGLISSATARADQTQILIKSWHSKNLICRGSLDQAISDKACEERLLYDKKLAALGWCYGKRDQPGNLHVWHVCEPNSEGASAALTMGARPGGRVVLVCSGTTINFGANAVVTSRKNWSDEILIIDATAMTVRHNDEPTGPRITKITATHYTWHENGTLITDGSFNRISGTGEERMTLGIPGFLSKNYYEHCTIAPPPKF